MEKSVVSLLSCFELCRRVGCPSSFVVAGRCYRGSFNARRSRPFCLRNNWKYSFPFSLFFLGIVMSDGRRNSSFMPHIDGWEIVGVMDTTVWTPYCYIFLPVVSHKTALHVQDPTRNLQYMHFSICSLNTRQHYTYNIHTRACARTFLRLSRSVWLSHFFLVLVNRFFRLFRRFFIFVPGIFFGFLPILNVFP